MATSGSYDFTSTTGDIIRDALYNIGILAQGVEPDSYQYDKGVRQLNLMIKSWKNKGIDLWCYQQITIFPVVGQEFFKIGPSGDRAAADAHLTNLAADAASGASTISVDAIGDTASGDAIGVELDDGTLQWTTVNGAPSGTTITLTDTLTGAASDNNRVYTYNALTQRITRFMQGRTINKTGNEAMMHEVSQMEYDLVTPKSSQGLPNQWYYNPQLDNGRFYVWQTFSSVSDVIRITGQRPIQDVDVVTDNPDFPVEAQEMLGWNLARRMLVPYGITDPEVKQEVKEMAAETLADFEDYDTETASLQFVPG